MKQALVLVALAIGGLHLGSRLAGFEPTLLVVSGAVALMALMIAATFLWLWAVRATPLALGMALSWLGAGLFVGWWWVFTLAGWSAHAAAGPGLFLVLGPTLVGAGLHFAVIHRSFGRHGPGFAWPMLVALALAIAIAQAV